MSELTFNTVETANTDSGFKRGDVVRMYKEDTKLAYPCIMLTCEKLEKFRVDAMRGILGNRSLISDASLYHVYINMKGQVVEIGVLPDNKLKLLLANKVFDPFKKCAHLDAQTTVEGDMLYALCLTPATY